MPIRALNLQSTDKEFEIKNDTRFFGGDSRAILFPKQARAFLADDLSAYVESRFSINPQASAIVSIDLVQAYSYFTMHQSGLHWVPFLGVGVAVVEGFQQVPVIFVVEAKASVTQNGRRSKEIDIFIRQAETVTGWSGTPEKNQEIYRREISKIRGELFSRLDAQLLSQWENGRFVGLEPSGASNVATLASEIARLDTALADGKISQTEYDQLLKAAKSRALSDYVNIETQHVPQGNGQYSALTHPSAVALPTNNGTGIIAVVVDQHVFVNEVRDDSAGSAAKIIPGDEIISFNGITDPKEIIAAINEPASSEAKVTWRRGQTAPQTARLTW